jgi:acetyltransferase
VILFGQGGTAVEIIRDRAVALPPLTMGLALELISRTRVARLLAGYRDRPKADLDALALALVQVSQLIADITEIVELDINPLFADETGVLALDARIALGKAAARGRGRLAISPYPQDLEETVDLPSGLKLLLRPIRPEDAPMHAAFFARLEPEDIRLRFFGPRRTIPPSEMARLTQIDYDREMAFIALDLSGSGEPAILGVVRTVTDPDNEEAEIAVIVRSDVKRRGIGRALVRKMIRYCTDRGTRVLVAHIMRENTAMLRLAEDVGFRAKASEDKDAIDTSLTLSHR